MIHLLFTGRGRKMAKIRLNCVICPNDLEIKINSKDWEVPETVDVEDHYILCPEHKEIMGFIGTQCPGCVGGFGDCNLFRSFICYGRDVTITDSKLEKIEEGYCPYRTNGTMIFGLEGLKKVNLSEQAPKEAGEALAEAIKEYIKRYGENND